MYLLLAVFWLIFWISGVALALIYSNIPVPLNIADGQIGHTISEPQEAMQCIMLHTVLCMPMVAAFLEKALLSGGQKNRSLRPIIYWILVVLHLAALLLMASFLAKGVFVQLHDGRNALDLFFDGTTYGGFISATVLLLLGALISMGEHATFSAQQEDKAHAA